MRVCDLSLAKWIVPYCLFFSFYSLLFFSIHFLLYLPLSLALTTIVRLWCSALRRSLIIFHSFNLLYLSLVYVSLFSELMLIKCSYVTNKSLKDLPDRCVKSSAGERMSRDGLCCTMFIWASVETVHFHEETHTHAAS